MFGTRTVDLLTFCQKPAVHFCQRLSWKLLFVWTEVSFVLPKVIGTPKRTDTGWKSVMDLDTENRKPENWKPEKQVFFRIFSQFFWPVIDLKSKGSDHSSEYFLELSKQMWFNGCVFVFQLSVPRSSAGLNNSLSHASSSSNWTVN